MLQAHSLVLSEEVGLVKLLSIEDWTCHNTEYSTSQADTRAFFRPAPKPGKMPWEQGCATWRGIERSLRACEQCVHFCEREQ